MIIILVEMVNNRTLLCMILDKFKYNIYNTNLLCTYYSKVMPCPSPLSIFEGTVVSISPFSIQIHYYEVESVFAEDICGTVEPA